MIRSAGSGPSEQPDVVVSHEFDPDEDAPLLELEGHLKVTTWRHFHLDVPYVESDEAPRRFMQMNNPHNQCGPLLAEEVPVVTGNDYHSFMAAFNKRCNTVHEDDLEDDQYSSAYDILSSLPTKHFDAWDENELDRARWMGKFDQRKRARMEQAYHEVPETSYRHIGTKDLSVKQEVLLKRNDPSWAPRVIYAGNDVFNAVTGPAMMVAMERLCQVLAIGPICGIQFLTAYKQKDTALAQFISGDDRLTELVEGDYSANDKHQRKRVHLLFDRFLTMIKMPVWLRKIFLETNIFKVQSRSFGFQATLENQLDTGTTATTPRNSLYNILMFADSMRRQGARGRALVLGDDLLAALNKRVDLRAWVTNVSLFKMVLKAKRPATWGKATFLSRRLVCDREEPCMVPLLGKALARFNARALYVENKTHSQYMAGKSLSYAYEFRHVPFMRDFFLQRYVLEDRTRLSLDDLTWHAKTAGVDLENIVDSIKAEEVLLSDDEFRDWTMETYDIGLCDLEELCEEVLLSDEVTLVDHPIVANLSMDW